MRGLAISKVKSAVSGGLQLEIGTRRFAASDRQAELLRLREWQSPSRSSRHLPAADAGRAPLRTARESHRDVRRSPDGRPDWLSSSRDTLHELSFRRRELLYQLRRRQSLG